MLLIVTFTRVQSITLLISENFIKKNIPLEKFQYLCQRKPVTDAFELYGSQ